MMSTGIETKQQVLRWNVLEALAIQIFSKEGQDCYQQRGHKFKELMKMDHNLILFRRLELYYSPFHNTLALLHGLTLLTTFMGQSEFTDKNAH